MAYFSLLEFARTTGNGLHGQLALLCLAIKRASWSCRSQKDKRYVKQTWNQLQIKLSPAKTGPANQHTYKQEINVYFCMPLGLGMVFMSHYCGNNWMTKTKRLIFRSKKGNDWPLQMHLPYLEFCAEWQEQKSLEEQDSLTPAHLKRVRKPGIFSDDSPTALDWFPPACFADFCLHLSQEA